MSRIYICRMGLLLDCVLYVKFAYIFGFSCYVLEDAKWLIGRRFYDLCIMSDVNLWPFKVIVGVGNKPSIIVTYKEEEKQLAAKEIASMVLRKMK